MVFESSKGSIPRRSKPLSQLFLQVMVGARDEASISLSDGAKTAIKSLGATMKLRTNLLSCYVFVAGIFCLTYFFRFEVLVFILLNHLSLLFWFCGGSDPLILSRSLDSP